MMTLMKLVNSATKFRHGFHKFYQPNSGLRSSRTWDEAIYTHAEIYIYIYVEIIYIYIYRNYIYIHIIYQDTRTCVYIYTVYMYTCIEHRHLHMDLECHTWVLNHLLTGMRMQVVGRRLIERRLFCVFLFLLYFWSRFLVFFLGWGGVRWGGVLTSCSECVEHAPF